MTTRPPVRGARGSVQIRLRFVMIALMVVASFFAARLVQLQAVDPHSRAELAASQSVVEVTLPAKRGQIVDRNGVALAESVNGKMLVADPMLTRPHAAQIAKLLVKEVPGLDYLDAMEALTKRAPEGKPDVRFAYIARRVPANIANRALAAFEETDFKGVTARPDPLRDYPATDVAVNLIGFVGADGDGLGGLEFTFNQQLAGKDGKESYEVGAGKRIPLGFQDQVAPVDGRNLKLTIDRDVQWYTQRVLRKAVDGVRAQSGAAVVLDSRTGEILALADYPTYDPNRHTEYRKKDLGARSLSDVYEPGSVAKVLTVAGAIEAGKVTPQTKVRVPGKLELQGRTIGDWWSHGQLRMTVAGIIARSSNIGSALIGAQMTPKRHASFLRKFGLGVANRVGIQGETAGILPPGESWTPLNQATISFGQSVSVNALQMAAAVNTIANGGEYISPSLIQGSATAATGNQVGTDHAKRHTVVSEQTAKSVTRFMEMVTNQQVGTAPKAAIDGYRVAGKTGTAQQVGEKCRCYDGSMAVSFAGFAPADDPRFTVYVLVNRPAGGAGGGSTAGPVFRQIMSYLLQKYGIPPTGTKSPDLPMWW